jgi:ABC-type antimicrobial peptide transport system permease subunit
MLWNYIKISFRKFLRQKFYSLLNIFGLATGMATVILILLYVLDESSYDRFHRFQKDIYRVVENQYYSGQPVFPVAVTPGPLAEALKADYPEVELSTRVHFGGNTMQFKDDRFDEQGIYVDKDFLHMFDFPFVSGDTATALREINSVLITEKLAAKLFGKDTALGKTLTVKPTERCCEREVVVTGILKDIPENSHLKFAFVMPFEQRLAEFPFMRDNWGSNTLYTYVKLTASSSSDHLDKQIQKYLRKKNEGSVTDLYLQPITDIHLGKVSFVADLGGKGNKQYVMIFSIVAVFILIIACINFMNLSTARAIKRAKEVGLRKTIGAYRHQLIFQFLGESVLVALVSMCIALLLVDLLLSPFNTLTQKNLALDYTSFSKGSILPIALGATIVTGLLAGAYPAVFLSSFQPAHVLKGTASGKSAGGTFRKVLVVVQFSISIVMISGTMIIYSQMEYIRNKNLGWERENMLIIRNANNYHVLKDKLLNYPEIKGVAATNQHPTYVMNSTSGIGWKGKSQDDVILFHVQGVDFDYTETMKIELLKGRSFQPSSPGDTLSTLINEEAAKTLKFEDPIGEQLEADGQKFTIIGVVKDFHFKSIHDKIEPLVLYIEREDFSNMLVRIEGNPEKVISSIEKEWQVVNPDQAISYTFMNEDFDNLYRSESQTGTIFQYFSVLAILISCLGLFGLASFTVEQKSKEYGIRKVFGASVSRLFFIASRDFLILVIIAFFISVPLAWFWMKQWLNEFAYHIELSFMVFLISGILAMLIALITVSYQAGKVGLINPARTLRSE